MTDTQAIITLEQLIRLATFRHCVSKDADSTTRGIRVHATSTRGWLVTATDTYVLARARLKVRGVSFDALLNAGDVDARSSSNTSPAGSSSSSHPTASNRYSPATTTRHPRPITCAQPANPSRFPP